MLDVLTRLRAFELYFGQYLNDFKDVSSSIEFTVEFTMKRFSAILSQRMRR